MQAAEMAKKAAQLDSGEFDVVFSAAHMLRGCRVVRTPGSWPGLLFSPHSSMAHDLYVFALDPAVERLSV
uniref:Uncharacterized protein n=1 Tax=Knipowitschia caucasica TaxID=637954 RepID=A0AAV2L587_KNICA